MKTRKSAPVPTRARRRPKAATQDVLGGPGPRPRIPGKWRKHYEDLLRIRASLLRRQGDHAQDALEERPSFSTHMADAGTDTYDRDFALGVLSSEQDALYEVDGAINRIRNRTYGICELTGKPIELARLAAIPWTRFSAAAEKQLEKEGVLKRTRLGPRVAVTREPVRGEADEAE
jgi:DnaK suppressor protein